MSSKKSKFKETKPREVLSRRKTNHAEEVLHEVSKFVLDIYAFSADLCKIILSKKLVMVSIKMFPNQAYGNKKEK